MPSAELLRGVEDEVDYVKAADFLPPRRTQPIHIGAVPKRVPSRRPNEDEHRRAIAATTPAERRSFREKLVEKEYTCMHVCDCQKRLRPLDPLFDCSRLIHAFPWAHAAVSTADGGRRDAHRFTSLLHCMPCHLRSRSTLKRLETRSWIGEWRRKTEFRGSCEARLHSVLARTRSTKNRSIA